MEIPFTKAHGTGNDFIILYSEDIKSIKLTKNLIKRLCHRRTGVGADGLLVLSPNKKLDFKMDYYNNDGTWETLCANGARCAVLYMHNRGLIEHKTSFSAGDGIHDAEIIDDKNVRLQMKTPKYKSDLIKVEGLYGRHVDSGAQHFAIQINNLAEINVYNLGKKIRYSNEFSPNGINVNFFTKQKSNLLRVETYEKGIEKVMLSCGSGSVAAAFHASNMLKLQSPVNVSVPGGVLKVEFDKRWKNVWVTGETIILFKSFLQMESVL